MDELGGKNCGRGTAAAWGALTRGKSINCHAVITFRLWVTHESGHTNYAVTYDQLERARSRKTCGLSRGTRSGRPGTGDLHGREHNSNASVVFANLADAINDAGPREPAPRARFKS